RNLNQIIDFCAFADNRVIQRTAINRGIGANFDIVLNDDAAKLGNLLQTGRTRNITETILSNPDTRMERNVITNESALDGNAWGNITIAPDLAAFANDRR